MVNWFFTTLRTYPEIAIFLALAFGYHFGKFTFKGIGLGAVTATLLAGVVIGQIGITISQPLKATVFLMFLFAVGYAVGPQFVRGVAKDGLPQALFSVVQCVFSLLACVVIAKFAGYDLGYSAGFYSGSQTISAAMGLSTDAINRLGLEPAKAKALLDSMPVAYAVTYMFGTMGSAIVIAVLGPKLLGINLFTACKDYEEKQGGTKELGGAGSAWRRWEVRAFRVAQGGKAVGLRVPEAEALVPDARVFILRIRRDQTIEEATADTVLREGDGVAVRATDVADVAFIGAWIVMGALLGALVFKVGGAPITLSTAGGALIAGIVGGWFRSVRPSFGRIPSPTVWFMNSVGLNIFIAIVGISAGPGFVNGLKTQGIGLFLWGALATTVPLVLGMFVAKYVFRFHDALTLGIVSGSRTTTASLGLVCDQAKSQIPALGYTVTYAVGNTLLTIWGMIIIMLLS